MIHPTWRQTRIGDCASIVTKGGTPTSYGFDYRTEGIAFIRVENLRDGVVQQETITSFIDSEADEFLKRSRLAEGDVLISIAGTIGRTAIVRSCDLPANTNQAVALIRGTGATFAPKFLCLALSSADAQRQAVCEARGGAMQNISLADVKNIVLPVPELDEQKRIVAEIEKQFTRLEAGVASLKRVQAALKRYRASVLKAACEGRLLPTEAEWPVKPIKVAIRSLDQGWSPKCESEPTNDPDAWTVMKTTAVQPLRYLDRENKRLPSSLEPRPQLELTPGDLLVTRAGPRSRAGVVCLVRTTRPRVMLCDKVYRLRCDPEIASAAFLELVLNAPHVVDAIDELKTGISDSGVNLTQTKFRELAIPLPPLAEQHRIVAEVERRLSVIEELEAVVAANLQRATRLRQSILHRAFSGTLLRQ